MYSFYQTCSVHVHQRLVWPPSYHIMHTLFIHTYIQLSCIIHACTYNVHTVLLYTINHCPSDAVAKKEYCSVELSEAKYKAFVYAIRNHYWYQMYIGETIKLCNYYT